MFKFRIFLVVLVCTLGHHEVVSIIGMIGDLQLITNFVNDAKDFGNGDLPLVNFMMGSTGFALSVIQKQVDSVSESLAELARTSQFMNTRLEKFMNSFPVENKIDAQLSELHSYIVRVDGLYRRYEKVLVRQHDFSNYTIMNFIEATLSDRRGDLPDILYSLSNLMQPERSAQYREPLPDLLYRKYASLEFPDRCNNLKSQQQRLYELYSTVMVTEAKAYTMTLFAYAFYMTLYKIPMIHELEAAGESLIERAELYIQATKRAMSKASAEIIRCEPNDFIRDENFAELEGAIQLIVVPEPDATANSCGGVCSAVDTYDVSAKMSCDSRWCSPRTCYGRVNECWDEHKTVELCELENTNYRRYGYIKFHSGQVFGDKDKCDGDMSYAETWLRGFSTCAVCVCTCSEQSRGSTATRTINLGTHMADIKANKVVIGIQFVHKDKQIMLRIKQAKLNPGANIEWGTVEQSPLDDYDVDEYVRMNDWYRTTGGTREQMKPNLDYSFITYWQKKIFLDEIRGPTGYVVTGVRFGHEFRDPENAWWGAPIQLEVHFTKFDFVNGTLYQDADSSMWLRQQDMKHVIREYRNERTEVKLVNPDDPTRHGANTEISGPNRWIEFAHSDGPTDAGQSTVPFFDTQEVGPAVMTPLSGIGLIHRGAAGSGGILTFRVFTVDLREYLNDSMDMDFEEERG